jgi:cell division protein FtsB
MVERTLAGATQVSRSYERLALVSMLDVQRAQERMILHLQGQNRALRRENDALQEQVKQLGGRRGAEGSANGGSDGRGS